MKLMTAAILKALPPLYSTEKVPTAEKVAVAKLFDPSGRMTLYIVEGSPEGDDVTFFGYMVSPQGPDCDEFGNSSLNELQAVKGRFGLGLERDRSFQPTKLVELVPSLAE
jgi:hypothetical protein